MHARNLLTFLWILSWAGLAAARSVSFHPPQQAALAGTGAGDNLRIALLDGDDNLDIVVTPSRIDQAAFQDGANIMLGDGLGGFWAAQGVAAGVSVSGLALADLNGDGNPDLVTTEMVANKSMAYPPCSSLAAGVPVLLGNGTGDFVFQSCLQAAEMPAGVAAGDFNEDGKVDLIVVNAPSSGGITTSDNVYLFAGNGNGTFAAGQVVQHRRGRDVQAADFNGDNHLDLVIGNTSSSYIFLGSGTGTFTEVGGGFTGPTSRIAVGDINRDGRLDVATVGSLAASSTDDVVWIALNNGTGVMSNTTSIPVGSHPVGVVVADLNRDGFGDVITANNLGNSISILLGGPSGMIVPALSLAAGTGPTALGAGDLDRDGYRDLAVANDNDAQDGSLAVLLQIPPPIVAPTDFDADGKSDVAVWRPADAVWWVRRSGTPGSYTSRQWGAPADIPVAADYDGDGTADIAVWRPSNGMWYMRPSGTPGTYLDIEWGIATDIPVPGDYDGDGSADVAVWRPQTGIWFILKSSAPGTHISSWWGLPDDIPVPGDYDGDGRTDIAVWRPGTGRWYILNSNTPGTYKSYQWGMSTDLPVPGDYDGDGKTDAAVLRPSSGVWFVMPSSAPSTYKSTQWGMAGDVPVPGDYDGDGTMDIAVWRPSSGIWYARRSSLPGTYTSTSWGKAGDVPQSYLTPILQAIP
jgi:hypothetical protein